MVGGQRWVVAPNLGACAARDGQEEEIVDGDDLGRVARGNEQRVRRVHDVGWAGQGLDWRPLGPVPEQVEDPHRDPASRRPSDAEFGAEPCRWTILPRAREDRHRVVVRGAV